MKIFRVLATLALFGMAGAAQAGPIHDAAAANDVAAIVSLIASGVPVDELNAAGETALIVAAKVAADDAVNVLVHNLADVNFTDPSGRRALHWLVLNEGSPQVVSSIRFLYEALADMNAHDADGATALILAADRGDGLLVSLLMSGVGTEVEATDKAGRTALTRAGLNGHKTVVTMLLRLRAVCQPDIAEWTAACEARKAELGIA
ncbi:MAG TPA: ankyrin repeat domain-containing protein [Hyphomicrobiaceae bacterium]|nr:ankyrin repeat domain-containing protein [Hyphomicrobiaceae bacterium]